MLTNISVAQAAALINAAIVICKAWQMKQPDTRSLTDCLVNLTFPLLTAAIAIGTIVKDTNAATWCARDIIAEVGTATETCAGPSSVG